MGPVALLNYFVLWREKSSSNEFEEVMLDNSTGSTMLADLLPFKEYEVQVFASNAFINGSKAMTTFKTAEDGKLSN